MKIKRADEEKARKRQKSHLQSCDEANCQGCAVGEIDIDLRSKDGSNLSANDIFQIAMEEKNKQSLTAQDIDSITHSSIVTKLFEQALASFKSLDICDLNYCRCLFEFGLFVHVKDYFETTEQELEKYLKSSSKNSKDAEGWLLLGRVYLELAHFTLGDDDSDSDSGFVVQDKTEQKYLKRAICAFKKSLELSDNIVNTQLVVSGSLLDHALLQKTKHLVPSVIIQTIKTSLELAPEDKSNLLACRICGTASFHLANLESHRKNPKMGNALKDVKNAISLLEKVTHELENPNLSDFQILGQSWLLLSSLEIKDDDLAIQAFDAGALALKNALSLDPENVSIRQQLADMEMLNDDQVQYYSS